MFRILFIALLGGCVYTPMTVTLSPNTFVSSSEVGYGKTIDLIVNDERTEDGIGNRGSVMMKGAKITLTQDLTAVVQSALTEMLTTKGFQVRHGDSDTGRPSLTVDIRGLHYSTSTGFWTGGVEITAALKALAEGETETYQNFYRYENEDRIVFVPGAKNNREGINLALNDVLHQLIGDNKLLEVLAEP